LANLRELIAGKELIVAPVALNPIMARLAEAAGFKALYLSGGSLGWYKGGTEANITMTELAQVAVDMRAVSKLPIVLDAGGGFGDPVHMHRTIAMTEAAGFAAIEIEDQPYPKRAGHHVGDDDIVPPEVMEAKIRSAVAARRNDDFLIIARTNAATTDPDEAIARSEGYRRAGADVLMPVTGAVRDPEIISGIGRQLGPPLMFLAPPGGLAHVGLTLSQLHGAGYRLITDAMSLHLLVYATLQAGYAQLAENGFQLEPERPAADWWKLVESLHETIDLDRLLAIERGTADATR
jgi:methylisocitrate lyase